MRRKAEKRKLKPKWQNNGRQYGKRQRKEGSRKETLLQ